MSSSEPTGAPRANSGSRPERGGGERARAKGNKQDKGVHLIFSPYVKGMSSARGALSLARLSSRSVERCRGSREQSRAWSSSSATIRKTLQPAPAHRLPSSILHPSSRLFTASSICLSPGPVKDPHHPSGLYFHLLPNSKRYAISFLSQPPTSPTSASIIAFITPPSSNQEEVYDLVVQQPDLVEAHKPFLDLMHDTLKNECVPQDGLLEYEAYLRKDGWAHLNGAVEGVAVQRTMILIHHYPSQTKGTPSCPDGSQHQRTSSL